MGGLILLILQAAGAAIFFVVAAVYASIGETRCALLGFSASLAWVVVAIQQYEISQRDRMIDSLEENGDDLLKAYAKIDLLTELLNKQKKYERKTTTEQNKKLKNRQYGKENDKGGCD